MLPIFIANQVTRNIINNAVMINIIGLMTNYYKPRKNIPQNLNSMYIHMLVFKQINITNNIDARSNCSIFYSKDTCIPQLKNVI